MLRRERPCRGVRAAGLAMLGCIAVLAGATPPAAAAVGTYPVSCVPRPAPVASSSQLRGVTVVARGRLRTYTMTSPAVGVTHVNVLLPAGYDRTSSTRYPVLYLLHGALGSYADWASTTIAGGGPQGGNVQSLVGKLPIIVVMPDDSPNGAYADWYGISAADAARTPVPRAPAWETFHVDELVPWVDATFSTEAEPAGRVVAGLSSGGAGAAKYAAAHPGLFGFVGMFSGALDNDLVDGTTNTYSESGIFHSAAPPDDRCRFGDPFTNDAKNSATSWYDSDPTYEAGNLAGVRLFVASGNGTPTTADARTNPGIRTVQGIIESAVDDMSHHFVAAVRHAGLGANLTTDFYGGGVHSWYYWQRDLTSFLAWLRPQLGKPVARPSAFSYRTARASSAAWGWSFRHDSGIVVRNVNTASQFVYLNQVSPNGFTAEGNGTLRVTTPRGSYPALSSHDVRTGRSVTTTRADAAGQLRFTVVIGPKATHPQVAFPAAGAPAGTPRVRVAISETPRSPRRSHGSSAAALIAAVVVALLVLLVLVALVVSRRRRR